MLKKLFMSAAVVAFLATAVPTAKAESSMDFTLVNSTGYDIKEIFIGPTKSDDWGPNILKGEFPDGESVEVTFKEEADDIESWDLMVAWDGDYPNTYWRGFKLADINKITLKYNRKKDETSASVE